MALFLPEANVLIHALRKDSAEHECCRQWRGRGSDRRELWQEVGQAQPAGGGDFGNAARVGNVEHRTLTLEGRGVLDLNSFLGYSGD